MSHKKRKLNLDNDSDMQEMVALLDEVDIDDEFLDDIESENSNSTESSRSDVSNITNADLGDEAASTMESVQESASWCDECDVDRSAFDFSGNSGVKINLTCKTSPSEIFECFVDREVIDLIVSETNKFAAKYIHEKRTGGKMHRKSRDLMWTDTNPGEMRVVIALIILQGIVKKPNIDDYHSMHLLLHTPIFGKIISRERLKLILKYLHFSDLEKTDDALYKIRKLMELLVSEFRTNYVPEKKHQC